MSAWFISRLVPECAEIDNWSWPLFTHRSLEKALNHRSKIDPQIWREDPQAQAAIEIVRRLQQEGFVSYLAGGCVRDTLLGQKPKDYDVATDAVPDRVREIFGRRRTMAFGAAFGVIGVLPSKSMQAEKRDGDEQPAKLAPTEVATFRSDGEYSDGRRPDRVHFGNAEADALRRDFTINGMFCDPMTNEVIDYVGGQEDLNRQVLRTIGNPEHRFAEDKLRMLRAVRFATTLGFELDHATFRAVRQHAHDISVVSGERIGVEMRKILSAEQAFDGLRMVEGSGLASEIWPSLSSILSEEFARRLRGIPEPEQVVQRPLSRFVVALACGLQLTENAELEMRWLRRHWKLSTEEVRATNAAIQMFPRLLDADRLRWSQIQPLLIDRDIGTAMSVAMAAIQSDQDHQASSLGTCAAALRWPDEKLNPEPLLTGNDLQQMGYTPGPSFGALLRQLRDHQLDEQILDRQSAIQWIGDQISQFEDED